MLHMQHAQAHHETQEHRAADEHDVCSWEGVYEIHSAGAVARLRCRHIDAEGTRLHCTPSHASPARQDSGLGGYKTAALNASGAAACSQHVSNRHTLAQTFLGVASCMLMSVVVGHEADVPVQLPVARRMRLKEKAASRTRHDMFHTWRQTQ